MNQIRRARPAALIPLTLVAVLVAGTCSKGPTDAQKAQAALTAGLKAHAAGRLDEAAADYRKVLVLDPRNKFAYYNLGVIDQTQGDAASAESNYGIALTIDPDFVSALFNLAILRNGEGNSQEAMHLYKHVIRVNPSYASAHLNLGFLLIANGQTKTGQTELARAVQLDPSLASRIPPDLQASPAPTPSAPRTSSPA